MAAKKAGKVGAASAEAYMEQLDHPLKAEIEALRIIIRKADPRLSEGVKWNAPSYGVDGEDRITFNLRAKDKVLLIFHCGPKTKVSLTPRGRIEDPTGLLAWAGDDRAIATFQDMDEVKRHKAALGTLVRQWIEATTPEA